MRRCCTGRGRCWWIAASAARREALAAWLRGQGVAPERLALVVNTHDHSDHVGGNFLFHRLGVPIAAHAVDAALVNARDPKACSAAWLRQPVPPYAVARPLDEGDAIDTGGAVWHVLRTPGHNFGHISLWCARKRVLIAGDTVHADDLGWLAPCRDGPGTLAWMRASVARLAALDAALSLSGHGPRAGISPPPAPPPRRGWRAGSARQSGWPGTPASACLPRR